MSLKDKFKVKLNPKQLYQNGSQCFQKINHSTIQNKNVYSCSSQQTFHQINDYFQTLSTRCPSQPNSMQIDLYFPQKSDFQKQNQNFHFFKSGKTLINKLQEFQNCLKNQTSKRQLKHQNHFKQEQNEDYSSNTPNNQNKSYLNDEVFVEQNFLSQVQRKSFNKVKFKQIVCKFGIKKSVSMAARKKIQLIRVDPGYATKYTSEKPLRVTISQLAQIYTLSPRMQQSVILHQCCDTDSQKLVFEGFMENIKRLNNEKIKTKLTLAKMRTIIVRRALNQLVDIIVQPGQNQQFHIRMNMEYRNRYKKAGIPIPPARMQNSYLQKLFNLEIFTKYYQKFIDENLLQYLQRENKEKVKLYEIQLLYLVKSITKKVNSQKISQILQKCKKPFTKVQISLIRRQAEKMLDQYGKGKKRIGNKKQRKEIKYTQDKEKDKLQTQILLQDKQNKQIKEQQIVNKIKNQEDLSNSMIEKFITKSKQKKIFQSKQISKSEQNCRPYFEEIQLINSFQDKHEQFQFNSDEENNSFQKLLFG